MRDWQKRFVYALYATDQNNRRIVRRAILSVARKNGKTALIATLVLAHLVGPEAIINGEVYSAANDREQAAIVFKYCSQVVALDPELSSLLRVIPSTKVIACLSNGSRYKALSSESGTKHGLNPSVVIYDELAQSKTRDLFDALDTSMAARAEPLLVIISTQSQDPQHPLSQLIDDAQTGVDSTTYCQLYEAPEDCDLLDEKAWLAANPALGDFRDLQDMRILAKRAARAPSFEASFRNLYLNQRVDGSSPLVSRTAWMACKGQDELRGPLYLGLDLSNTVDLSALVAVSGGAKSVARAWFWKPSELIADHTKRDRFDYARMTRDGWIESSPGKVIDVTQIAERIDELHKRYGVRVLAYDRWRIENLLKALQQAGLSVSTEDDSAPFGAQPDIWLHGWGQGFASMAPSVDALETAIINQKLVHDGNPVLTWCMANAQVQKDPAGNRKFDKSLQRQRIDGAVALVMAMGVKAKLASGEEETALTEEELRSLIG